MSYFRVFYLSLFLNFCLTLINCNYVSSSDKEKEIAERAILLNFLTARPTTTSARSCEVAAPAFSTLKTAGFESSCGRSGCHDGTTRFQVTNYSQVRALTVPSNADNSLLFTKQSTGSMVIYTNPTIDKAIYCWIQGGANP
jgi:hypothetical protein